MTITKGPSGSRRDSKRSENRGIASGERSEPRAGAQRRRQCEGRGNGNGERSAVRSERSE
jgi:hypothetical protein